MRTKLLLIACYFTFLGYTHAQVAPRYFYNDATTTNTLGLSYDDGNLEHWDDSLTGPSVPYEGINQLILQYKDRGGWGPGFANFTLGAYVETPPGSGTYLPEQFDFTAYTHLQFAWKGDGGNGAGNTLKFYLEDATEPNRVPSSQIVVGTPANTTGYQFASVPLTDLGTDINWTNVSHIVFLLDQLGTATYYIDNLRVVDCSAAAPAITSFTSSGAVGAVITINGTDLQNVSHVSFNGTVTGRITNITNTSFDVEVPVGATTGHLTVYTCSSVESTTDFTVATPAITSFTPTSANAGDLVTITGTNLAGVTSVSFNGGITTEISNATSTSLEVIVPATAATGNISVISSAGTGVSATPFTFLTVYPAPTIASISATSGYGGDVVTISGTNFLNTTGITFNGVNAPVYTILNATTIEVTVPFGATDGLITVTTTTGTANSAAFDVLTPVISSFSPASGIVGDQLTITGTNFSGISSVSINGHEITSFNSTSATSVVLTIPVGVSTGVIGLTTLTGSVTTSTAWRLDTLDIYTDLRDSVDNIWEGSVDCTVSKVYDPANAYEGDSVLVFQYSVEAAGWYAGFGANLNEGRGFDLTKFTHMKIHTKGTSASYPTNKLVLVFIDSEGDKSNELQVASITPQYELKIYNLLSEIKKDSVNFDLNEVVGFYTYVELVGEFQTSDSYFYLDNFKFVYDPSLGGSPTATQRGIASMNVTVAPNPSTGIYSLNTSEKVEEITVTDCYGNVVLKTTNNSIDAQIDISNQPDGMYFVTLSAQDKMVTKKIIKNK